MAIPRIDPAVIHVGLTGLRLLNKKLLRNLKGLMVIGDGNSSLAVIVPYESFLQLQGEQKMKWQVLGSQDHAGREITDKWEIYDEKGNAVTDDACLDLATAERIVNAHNSLVS